MVTSTTHHAIDVANYFLSLLDDNAGDAITNLKMQKLVYYAQGFALAILGRPIFVENIEAWMHGPVVPELYQHFRQYGNQPLPQPKEDWDLQIFTEEEKNLLNNVYETYGQFSAWRLRDMTHEEKPWRSTPANGIISHNLMKEYFQTLIVEEKA